MPGFTIKTPRHQIIRFRYYQVEAPVTVTAFAGILPFTKLFFHARLSGQEVWTDNAHGLDIIQENASVFTKPGEIVLGPLNPERAKTANCLGIYYGEGRGLDACNIFGIVEADDLPLLKALGEQIWKNGAQLLTFEAIA